MKGDELEIRFTIQKTGKMKGDEVAQI